MGINEELSKALEQNRQLNQQLIGYFQTVCLSLLCVVEVLAETDASFQRRYAEKLQAKVAQQGSQVGQVLLEAVLGSLQKKGKPN